MMTTQFQIRPDLEALPARLRSLPIDERGYPVPWFVAWRDGKPEFRAMDGAKLRAAIREKRCWVCGDAIGVHKTFVIGPMCGVNRVSAEPPSHLECAQWSARNCPFLANAGRRRREDEEINDESLVRESSGFAIARNPGVTLLWTTRTFRPLSDGRGGVLFRIGEPEAIEFYADGRPADRDRIMASVESGLPALAEMAQAQGEEAVAELNASLARFLSLVPGAMQTTAGAAATPAPAAGRGER